MRRFKLLLPLFVVLLLAVFFMNDDDKGKSESVSVQRTQDGQGVEARWPSADLSFMWKDLGDTVLVSFHDTATGKSYGMEMLNSTPAGRIIAMNGNETSTSPMLSVNAAENGVLEASWPESDIIFRSYIKDAVSEYEFIDKRNACHYAVFLDSKKASARAKVERK